jgi:SAM-dependent methyltransferase
MATESTLGRAYRSVYEAICGRHPHPRLWHFQWLAGHYLYSGLERVLAPLGGRVLDVGCGDQPYRRYFGPVTEYVGLDVTPGPKVDIVVTPDQQWPLEAGRFDVLLCSQVLEHVEHLDITLREMDRVLRPGGTMVLSFPFLYNVHGAPHDYRRFTTHWAVLLLPEYTVLHREGQGGLGSTIAVLLLNWLEVSLNLTFVGRVLKALLLPVWIVSCLVINVVGRLVDVIDRTAAYYGNVLVVLRKPG